MVTLLNCFAHEGHQKISKNIVGHNGLKYQQVEAWGVENLKKVFIKNCQGIVTDSKGRIILLTDDQRNNIIIMNSEGKLIKHWTLNLNKTHGLSITKDKDGKEVLFITDNGGGEYSVFKTDLDGKVLMKLGYPKESGKYKRRQQYRPATVLCADNGDFYVLDGYGLSYIIQYNHKGEYIRIFGGNIGKGDAQLLKWGPHGGVIDNRDPKKATLLIACSDRQRLKRFSMTGDYIETIPLPGANPRDIVIHNDHLFIPHLSSNWPKQRNVPGYVSILDKDDKVVSNIGGTKPKYEKETLQKMEHLGETFMHPHALTMDKDGNLYVAQWMSKGSWPLKFVPVKK